MNSQHGRPAGHPSAAAGRPGRWCLAAAATIACLAAAAPALSSASAGPGAIGPGGKFGLSVAPDSQGQAAPYFKLTVPPGHAAAATAIISNTGDTAETLEIGRSAGITATNGGSAFRPAGAGCSGPGCWVSGLPHTVTLPAHTHEMLNFTVSVPAGTADGQYLSGISAEPAARPQPVKVGSNGKASAQAIIVDQVTVGVAVTVGQLSTLTTRFRIPGVRGAIEGPTARLNIQLDNTGQTFANGTGRATCTTAGKQHAYTVFADTVLPHDQALIPVNAPGLPEGATVPCTVSIHYGNGQTVSWAGPVTVPAPPSTRIIHTGPGTYTSVPQGGIPVWAIVLICIGVLILAGIGVLIVRSRRPAS